MPQASNTMVRPGRMQASTEVARQMLAHYKKRWHWYVSVAVLFALLASQFTVSLNLTDSLPHRFYVVHKGAKVERGQYAAFRYPGKYHYPKDMGFVKQVLGVPGDRIERDGRQLFLVIPLGEALEKDRNGYELAMNDATSIAPGSFYMYAPNPKSLDSRYLEVGNVTNEHIIGRAYPVF